MLKKLLKYDFMSVGKLMIPFGLCVLIASVLGAAMMKIIIIYDFKQLGVGGTILSVSFGIFIFACFVAIFIFSFLSLFLILKRFYTNFFTDEGYLSFTLPVTTDEHLASKILNGFIWQALTFIFVVICLGITIIFGTSKSFVNPDIISFISEAFSMVFAYGESYVVFAEILLLIPVAMLYSLILFYLSITIGSIIAKKHKILASIGVFYGINVGISIILNILYSVIFLNLFNKDYMSPTDSFPVIHTIMITYIVIYGAIAVVSYFICRRMLNKKLNLA